jgi:hypothetical protein
MQWGAGQHGSAPLKKEIIIYKTDIFIWLFLVV